MAKAKLRKPLSSASEVCSIILCNIRMLAGYAIQPAYPLRTERWRILQLGKSFVCGNSRKTFVYALIDQGISYGSHLTFKDADEPAPVPLEEEIEQLRMIEPY